MALTTSECIDHLIEWVKLHKHLLPLDAYSVSIKANGSSPWITDGTTKSSWKRRGKKTINGVTLRAFECTCSIYDATMIVIQHVDAEDYVVKHEVGKRDEFVEKYGMVIKYW